jgi:hypothetical protein
MAMSAVTTTSNQQSDQQKAGLFIDPQFALGC